MFTLDFDLKKWVGTNLNTNEDITTVILVVSAIIIALVVWRLTKKLLQTIIPKVTLKTKTLWDDIIFNDRVINSFAMLIPALILDYYLPRFFNETSVFVPIAKETTDIFIILVSTWIINSFFSSINEILSLSSKYKDKPIGSFTQLAKILVYCVAAVLIISLLINKSPIYLLSGLGAMAAILLLVFKDSILGFVASIQLSANDMVHVGDWVTVPHYGADGDVLEINLTTIKVQNFDNTITTIPTYAFISDSFTNWRGMQQSDGRRIKRAIHIKMDSIKFCDSEMNERFMKFELISNYLSERNTEIEEFNKKNKIDTSNLVNGRNLTNVGVFRVYIEQYLIANPSINEKMMIMVRQLPSSELGLPIEIYTFSKDQSWKGYEYIMADLFDHIFAVAPSFDLEIFENPSGSDFKRLVKG
ncbi:MAG: mechanosensitive ion channel [Crocinitomicaceae bacterium]|nr:mechanosensitive ion channel [Crocinitomicaceae bacterium]